MTITADPSRQMTEAWVRAMLPGLADLAPVEHDQHGAVQFVRLVIPAADEDIIAWRCAVGLAARRLAGNPSRFAAWFGKLCWGQELANDDAERMRVPLLVNVGEPGAEASEDHLVGLVAEALWYELTEDLDLGSGLPVVVEAHDWSVTDHGGDGLAICSTAGQVALHAGILLLALDRPALFQDLQYWRDQLGTLGATWPTVDESPLASVDGVVRGCWDLLIYFVYGRGRLLESATAHFQRAIASQASAADIDSRWVAAHLLDLASDMGTRSVWSVLGPDLDPAARAMTLGDPAALLLWPPQVEFLSLEGHPLDSATRRLALSFPTSAGKTMLSQLMVLAHLVSGNGDACVVAPTHSLCREIARGLDRRLNVLGSSVAELALGPRGRMADRRSGSRDDAGEAGRAASERSEGAA
jgi:hypothetical protein